MAGDILYFSALLAQQPHAQVYNKHHTMVTHMKKCIGFSLSCLQLAALCLLIFCFSATAGAEEGEALPPGKVPEELYWIEDDGGAMDQEEFSGVTIHSVFRGSKSEPKVVMFYPSIGHEKIDTAIRELITAKVEAFFSCIEKDKSEVSDPSLFEPSKYILSSNYRVTFPTSNIVSVEFIFGTKLGWRALTHHNNMVYSRDSGKLLEFNDLFSKPQVALKLLSDWSRAVLPKELNIVNKYDIASGTEPKAANFSNFRVAPKGLHIQFGRYQVGPGAAGSPEIFIPLKKLESAGPSPAIWDKPDLRKIALSTPLKTPIPNDFKVSKENTTFLIPLDDVVALPCREGDYSIERCINIVPDFTLHTDATTQEFAFVEGTVAFSSAAVIGYLWGIYATEGGYKSTNFESIGNYYNYKSVSMKGNTILFKGVQTSRHSPERVDLKFSIVNGVLKKVN